MKNLTTQCPICKHEDVLEYSQQADILFKVVEGRLIPQLNLDAIGWGDVTYMYCKNCGASDHFNDELLVIRQEYDGVSL